MLEKLLSLLNFSFRQKYAIYRIGNIFSSIFKNGFNTKRVAAFFIALGEIFAGVSDSGLTPLGQNLDLTGYSLVFCDEFDGDAVDTDVWNCGSGLKRSGYNSADQVRVENGNLIITCEYLDDGEYGAGWYAGMITLKNFYRKGYFEIRCKCNDGGDFWSAFWLRCSGEYDHYISEGGPGGAEIDIFEAMEASKSGSARNTVLHAIHCNGGDEDVEKIDSLNLGFYKANNIYNEYNTYGLEWNDDEYIFYINGVETIRSSFSKGVSDVPEELVVSLEIPTKESSLPHNYSSCYVVDYVKIWQKN